MVRKQETKGAIMILFYNRPNDIQVIRTLSCTVGSYNGSDNIGVLTMDFSKTDKDRWIWDFSGASYLRSWTGFEALSGSEKRQIIGMLDKLNRIIYRNQDTMRARWEEITGLKGATL